MFQVQCLDVSMFRAPEEREETESVMPVSSLCNLIIYPGITILTIIIQFNHHHDGGNPKKIQQFIMIMVMFAAFGDVPIPLIGVHDQWLR